VNAIRQAPADRAPPFLTLDISRLLSRAGAAVPTGIDRVELAYAEYLLAHAADRTEFVALHPLGRFGTLPAAGAARFICALAARWDAGQADDGLAATLGRRLLHGLMLPRAERATFDKADPDRRRIYLLLSHHHLNKPAVVARAVAKRRAMFVPMVHDLIPLEYPEYARPGEPAKHAARIRTVVEQADAVLVPSHAVKRSLQPYLDAALRPHVPIWVVPHGVHLRAIPGAEAVIAEAETAVQAQKRPYFVCLGTIEPRKNHLLLLNIWRRMVEERGRHATPGLILIGKRGWENEQVIDMLERCPALQGVVEEHNALPDIEVVRLMKGARALLFPSFAEGYGLPLAEALSLGVPAVCADIPVFREVGSNVVRFLNPIDGEGWRSEIILRTEPVAEEARRRSGELTAEVGRPDWKESVSASLATVQALTATGRV